jgi:hypothetical protein
MGKVAKLLRTLISRPLGHGRPKREPLAALSPELDRHLRRRFAERWLDEAELSPVRLDDAIASVELSVHTGDQELHFVSRYTGSHRVLYGWNGSSSDAEAFIDTTARDEAYLIRRERELEGPTDWD